MVTIEYKDLMELGFKKHTAQNIIREAKARLVNDGYEFYRNQRVGVVPVDTVEEILGLKITRDEGEERSGDD